MQIAFAPVLTRNPVAAAFIQLTQWLAGQRKSEPKNVSAEEERVENIRALQRMARELESSQPNMAAELRYFAARS